MASYTFDVFSTLDGYGATDEWGGYWGKQGPELLDHRARLYDEDQLMVFGPTTYRMFSSFVLAGVEFDPWVTRMSALPKIVISNSMAADEPLPWPNATVTRGDAVDVVAQLKRESDLPLRSHGSLSMNRALMAGDHLPGHYGNHRSGPDLPRCRGIRPRTARIPNPGWAHPGTDLRADRAPSETEVTSRRVQCLPELRKARKGRE